jgi:hypothetical protein
VAVTISVLDTSDVTAVANARTDAETTRAVTGYAPGVVGWR